MSYFIGICVYNFTYDREVVYKYIQIRIGTTFITWRDPLRAVEFEIRYGHIVKPGLGSFDGDGWATSARHGGPIYAS